MPASPERLWGLLGRVEDYMTWWPFLRRFEADALVAGDEWHYRVRTPFPYSFRGVVRIERAVAPRLIVACASGDLSGWCSVELAPHPDGTEVRLGTELTAVHGPIRWVSGLVPRLACWTHDRVLDTATHQFEAALTVSSLRDRAGASPRRDR